jgi:hypothetical protein
VTEELDIAGGNQADAQTGEQRLPRLIRRSDLCAEAIAASRASVANAMSHAASSMRAAGARRSRSETSVSTKTPWREEVS